MNKTFPLWLTELLRAISICIGSIVIVVGFMSFFEMTDAIPILKAQEEKVVGKFYLKRAFEYKVCTGIVSFYTEDIRSGGKNIDDTLDSIVESSIISMIDGKKTLGQIAWYMYTFIKRKVLDDQSTYIIKIHSISIKDYLGNEVIYHE